MKKKYVFILAIIAVVLSGCFLFSSKPEDTSLIKLGDTLTVDNTDSRRILLGKQDALAMDGMYYAAWGMGQTEPYEDSDGKIVQLYDAQIHLLLGEYKDAETAQQNMNSWLETGRDGYDVIEETQSAYNGQTYTKLTYRFQDKEVPFSEGISVFTVVGSSALCIELTCRESFTDDPETTMADFLNCCTYLTEQ